MDELNIKLNQYFPGKVVRKDLTKKIKEGANVPVYVLEYLLGMYCATNDENAINDGVENVKKILADNFVIPDEAAFLKLYYSCAMPNYIVEIKSSNYERVDILITENSFNGNVNYENGILYKQSFISIIYKMIFG